MIQIYSYNQSSLLHRSLNKLKQSKGATM